MGKHTQHARAFTLIELLVVIGIITLLIGILIPVLGAARRAGKAAVCLSNLRQIGQATLGYTSDYSRHLPQPSQDGDAVNDEVAGRALWFNAIDYYLAQQVKDYERGNTAERNYVTFKQDPVWLELPEDEPGSEPDQRNQQTYKMNEFFGHIGVQSTPAAGPLFKHYKVTDVSSPSNTVLYIDGRAFDTPSVTTGNIDGNDFAATPIFVGLRHDNGANSAKVDGSAAHQVNPVRESDSGYRGWHYTYEDPTFTEEDRALWPEVIFNFRPESMGFERRYPGQR